MTWLVSGRHRQIAVFSLPSANTGTGPQEHPTAFLAALQYSGFVQYPHVSRNPRLTLAENLNEFANRKLEPQDKKYDSQTRRVGQRAHYVEQEVHDDII